MCGMLYNSTTQKVEAGEWLQVQDRPAQRSETIPPQHPALTYSHIYIYICYYLLPGFNQCPCKKSSKVCACNVSSGEAETGTPGTRWPASLVDSLSPTQLTFSFSLLCIMPRASHKTII